MKSKIRVLTEETINKIAAGEVIENSASVVKELVENSIDAGSTSIHVEIKGGGRQLIRITDDGCGMSHDDALLCLERHATSKIRQVDDIEAAGTLGFRGEAIPSIASISKFTLLTCPCESEAEGTMIIVDGGRIVKVCAAARAPGTTIEIKSLFFNVPARRKFQRSPAHDTTEVLKVLSNLALAYPTLSFDLVSEQQSLLTARAIPGASLTETLHARIAAVLGDDYIQQCCQVNYHHGECHLLGCVGLPLYSRPNRTGQHLFINGRAVFSPLISHLVREAYGTALPTNRHPLFVLQMTIPGGFVDVNVHPQKREVRLRQNDLLKELIHRGIADALQKSYLHTPLAAHTVIAAPALSAVNRYEPSPLPAIQSLPWEEALEPIPSREVPNIPCPHESSFLPLPVVKSVTTTPELAPLPTPPKALAALKGYVLLDPASCLHLPGYSNKTTGMVLLDQRAAHHRILFERLQRTETTAVQPLLIPCPVEFSALEAACIRETLPQLLSMGFEVEEFGSNTFLIRAVPAELDAADAATTLSELVEQLRDYQSDGVRAQERDKKLSLAASRLAVRREQQLTLIEAQQLVNQLFTTAQPYQCPFGKPTIVALSDKELAKYFVS